MTIDANDHGNSPSQRKSISIKAHNPIIPYELIVNILSDKRWNGPSKTVIRDLMSQDRQLADSVILNRMAMELIAITNDNDIECFCREVNFTKHNTRMLETVWAITVAVDMNKITNIAKDNFKQAVSKFSKICDAYIAVKETEDNTFEFWSANAACMFPNVFRLTLLPTDLDVILVRT